MRFVLVLMLAATIAYAAEDDSSEWPEQRWEIDLVSEYYGITSDEQTDFPIAELHQGCSRQDCIPSIDQPKFVVATAVDFLRDDDLVLGVVVNGDIRAYSARILQRHEIVNDVIGGEPIAITYCPLCGSGVAFSRLVNGETLNFGVSGILHNSDLVLFDRRSKTLWQQITGEAFAGPLRGSKLVSVPLRMTDWRSWKEMHPQSLVLSLDTGFDKQYDIDRYVDYRGSERIFAGGKIDPRLHPKRVVYGFEIEGRAIAFDAVLLTGNKPLQEQFAGLRLELSRSADGNVLLTDLDSGNNWAARRMFWFAWYSFHTDTTLITP